MTTKKLGLLSSSAIIVSLAFSNSAFAQGDEIIVTSTKRETTLQATPVAVSVASADTIEKARILDIKELGSVVPSLRVNQLQSSQNTNFVIRGFGNGANNAGIEPSVGVFIDGVYRSRSAARIGDLPKLNRIEVLRGPQSTLFGKNASAGVVSIVTAAPSFEHEGYAELGYGNYNNITAKAYVSGPISDNAAFSLGGGYNKRDGFYEPAASSSNLSDFNDRDRWNVRGQFLFEPTDNTSVRIIGDYSKADEICCNVTNFQNEGAAGAIRLLGGDIADANDPFAGNPRANFDPRNTLDDYGFSLHIDHDFEVFTLTSISSFRNNKAFFDTDADYGTLDLLDSVSSSTDIDTFTSELRLTSTGDNVVDWMVGAYVFKEDVIQDAGLGYGADLRNYIDILAGGPASLGGIEVANGIAPGTFFNDNVSITENFTQDNTSWSIFGTLDFHASDRLTVTGGFNFTRDHKETSGTTQNNDVFSNVDLEGAAGFNTLVLGGLAANFPALADAFGLGPLPFSAANAGAVSALPGGAAAFAGLQGQVVAGVGALDLSNPSQNPLLGLVPLQFQPQFLAFPNLVEGGKTNDEKLTWNLRAAWEMTDNINVYASASTGFKATSWNLSRDSRPFLADAANLVSGGLLPNNYRPGTGLNFATRFAGPEDATVYELGLKAKFEKGAINIALFDQQIEGFQSNIFLGTGFTLLNAGKQSTQGAEVDLSYTPVDPLTLTFAGTFLDPVYDVFNPGPGGGDFSGRTPAGIPSAAISTSATYNHDFDNGMTGFIRGDWQYESDVQTNENIATTTGAQQPRRQISIFNVSGGIDLENGFAVQLWGRNIFNDRFPTTVFPGVAQAGIINGYFNPPATYGVNVRKSW